MTWHRTSSASRGYGSQWRRVRERVIARDGGLCQECLRRGGRVTAGNHVDHIKAKASGGDDSLSNLELLCERHHTDKTVADRGGKRRPRIGVDGFPALDE